MKSKLIIRNLITALIIAVIYLSPVNGAPLIALDPEDIDFGPIMGNEKELVDITISNEGDEDLEISSITVNGQYFGVIFDENLVIQPDGQENIVAVFGPKDEGEFEGEIVISSNDPDHAETSIALTGTARYVLIAYDSGNPDRQFNVGDSEMEGACFSPAHPCSLLAIQIYFDGGGEMDLHIWGDNGAHEPDQTNDLAHPITLDINYIRSWLEINVRDLGITFDPPEDFHIGHVCSDGGLQFKLDDEETGYQQRGHLWTYNDGLRRDLWHTIPGNYLVRAVVKYYNRAEEYAFRNVSQSAGIGGISKAAWGDYDNDGWEDMLVNGRTLYRNLGDGSFENVSQAAGIVNDNPSHSGTWGDFDNDGWLDFYAITSNGEVDDRLYHNNGDGTFDMANETYGLMHGDNPTGACGWGDMDNDGYLDLYIANSEYWNDGNPEYFRDYLFHFDPDFQMFLNYTPESISRQTYYGRSVAWCDFDMDDDMDIYMSNYRLQPNFLFVNQGNLEFEDEAEDRGVRGYNRGGSYGHTIGSAWSDFDNDGDFDLLVGNFAHPWGLPSQDIVMLCRNTGAPLYEFEDIQEHSGIKYCETVFCPAWGDYDNDGWQDLFISAVYDGRQPFMYHSNGDGTSFENTSYVTGFQGICYNSYGVSWCDYDHDGDLDVAIGNGGLFENLGNDGHWAEFVLHGTSATVNKFAFGSQATVYAGDMQYLRQVEGGSGAESSQNSMTLHYGLGDADRIDSLVVNWIGGDIDRYYDIQANMRWDVFEGQELIAGPLNPGETAQPARFSLSAVYPNPFNSQVTVAFHQSVAGKIEFRVYTVEGRLIDVLSVKSYASGDHKISWEAAGVAAGSYIIQATHRNGVISRMVTLVR